MIALFRGEFAESIAREQQRLGRAAECADAASWTDRTRREAVLLALSSPAFGELERVVQTASGPVGLIAPVERHIIVGPWFDDHSSCVGCFRARLAANPPWGISTVLMEEILAFADERPEFAYAGVWRPLARTCLAVLDWLRQRPAQRGEFALVDLQGSLSMARFSARHGCACRVARGSSAAGAARFAGLESDLSAFFARSEAR